MLVTVRLVEVKIYFDIMSIYSSDSPYLIWIFLHKKVVNRFIYEQHDCSPRAKSHYLGDQPFVERKEPEHENIAVNSYPR